jgi:hypothetical protein
VARNGLQQSRSRRNAEVEKKHGDAGAMQEPAEFRFGRRPPSTLGLGCKACSPRETPTHVYTHASVVGLAKAQCLFPVRQHQKHCSVLSVLCVLKLCYDFHASMSIQQSLRLRNSRLRNSRLASVLTAYQIICGNHRLWLGSSSLHFDSLA